MASPRSPSGKSISPSRGQTPLSGQKSQAVLYPASESALNRTETRNPVLVALVFVIYIGGPIPNMYGVESTWLVEMFGSKRRFSFMTTVKEVGAVLSVAHARLVDHHRRSERTPHLAEYDPLNDARHSASAEDEALEDAPRPRRRSYAWAVGAALLALVLGAQAAYVYRVQLAASFPALKPALVVACGALDCTVPLPQQPRLISIEASDLQVPDASRPGVIQLTATLRSHAHYDLAYPALDLVLTNAQDHTLARRVFIPRDYLERGRDPAAEVLRVVNAR
jgi:hypothetical protein